MQNLRLWNNTISFQYWQKPGVVRLTKVYIFNVTNPDGFLAGEKPRLVEVGPFVYREDMEKTNIHFHDNYTVSFQHKKILQFVPELSVDKSLKIVIPNIPLLVSETPRWSSAGQSGCDVEYILEVHSSFIYPSIYPPYTHHPVHQIMLRNRKYCPLLNSSPI